MNYEPGNYQKGDQVKVARSRKEAVALTFEGYKPVEESEAHEETVADGSPTVSEDSAVPDETNDEGAISLVDSTYDPYED